MKKTIRPEINIEILAEEVGVEEVEAEVDLIVNIENTAVTVLFDWYGEEPDWESMVVRLKFRGDWEKFGLFCSESP